MAVAAPHISALPEPALRGILLTAVRTDNLLRYVAACARVCAEWRRVVAGSAAYGRRLLRDMAERARVLKAITKALEAEGSELKLARVTIGDAGAAALGAAVMALPTIRFTALQLEGNELTAAGLASLAPALLRHWGAGGLRGLYVGGNPLGDAGVVALAEALPPTLGKLFLQDTGCGDDGLVALAAALPALTRLWFLQCTYNPAATARGWVALAGALPSLPALETLSASGCTGMGSEGAAALAAVVPRCPRLRNVFVMLPSALAARTEPGFVALNTALQQLHGY
eukprot:COSAG04_NODE_423_length_14604_cov_8.047777_8_plen_285_part_00